MHRALGWLRHKTAKCYFAEVTVANPLAVLHSKDLLRLLRKENIWSFTDWAKVIANAADELSGRRPGTAMYNLQNQRPTSFTWTPTPTMQSHPLGDPFQAELESIKAQLAAQAANN